jgi:hypothetical protein
LLIFKYSNETYENLFYPWIIWIEGEEWKISIGT